MRKAALIVEFAPDHCTLEDKGQGKGILCLENYSLQVCDEQDKERREKFELRRFT